MEKRKNLLYKYIFEEKLSYIEIGKKYKVSDTAIRNAAKRLGFDLPQKRLINPNETFRKGITKVKIAICQECGKQFKVYSSSNGIFCSLQCFNINKHKKEYKKLLNGDKSIMKATYVPKNFKLDIITDVDIWFIVSFWPFYLLFILINIIIIPIIEYLIKLLKSLKNK